jgi:hypothetical protein
MAVVVQCFHCNAVFELDDGFRGGVCRCSTCGALLQVPSAGESTVARPVRPSRPPAPKSAASGDRQLEDSKTVLLDGGVSSSGLRAIHKTRPVESAKLTDHPSPTTSHEAAQHAKRKANPERREWIMWIGLVLVIILAVVAAALYSAYSK